ncbi:hypothetical protein AZE42_04911 [Rhizopogon vesiculosus]|uniref:Ricin B lectin domain-containing protein n=1 Tax=Rhizopogon vesiculosus TaxID=180088 RepID=A0A1J8R0Z0_9AGAM|nr:hypothetical protein AZE42_04911 [Rhizopogon vesiculosus]
MASIQDQHPYTLTNCQGDTILDLSGIDNYSIIRYQNHNGTNQQWVFERADTFWFIKSPGSDQYFGILGDISNAQHDTRVIPVSSPCAWAVENSDVSGSWPELRISAWTWMGEIRRIAPQFNFEEGGKAPIGFRRPPRVTGRTVLNLSDADNRSINGFHARGSPNQSWIFQRDHSGGNNWYIKSANSGQFLGIDGHIDKIKNSTRVVAVSSPFRWNIKDSDIAGVRGIRILVHGTVFSVDLDDHGLSADATRVQLWERLSNQNQIWVVKPPMPIQDQHTYTPTNCKGGTVLDLSGADNRSIAGFHAHGGPNQSLRDSQWIFQRDHSNGNNWYIKSASSGQFLGMEGLINNIRDGTRVVAVSSPFRWNVEDSDIADVRGIRILPHGTGFSLDLSDHGNSAEGTEVQLCGRWAGHNQIWAVKACGESCKPRTCDTARDVMICSRVDTV